MLQVITKALFSLAILCGAVLRVTQAAEAPKTCKSDFAFIDSFGGSPRGEIKQLLNIREHTTIKAVSGQESFTLPCETYFVDYSCSGQLQSLRMDLSFDSLHVLECWNQTWFADGDKPHRLTGTTIWHRTGSKVWLKFVSVAGVQGAVTMVDKSGRFDIYSPRAGRYVVLLFEDGKLTAMADAAIEAYALKLILDFRAVPDLIRSKSSYK